MRITNWKIRLTISALLLATVCTAVVGKTIYVDYDATGANNGTSWENAYNFLQDALADANSAEKPVEIWVAQGTYTPDAGSAVPYGTGEREATFLLINGVSIYGGFPSGGAEFWQRDPNLYETILSGDLDGNDVPVGDPCDLLNEPTRSENSYHVVTAFNTDETDVLDGFTISGGNAYGRSGGGMDNYYSSPSIANCTFSGNSAGRGGGMTNFYWSSPTLTNCTFSDNSAEHGGGMRNYDRSSPTPTDCTFSGNSAEYGGGMYNDDRSSPTLTDCTFNGNSAQRGGGGMCNALYSDPTLTNCMFKGNSAEGGGGMDNSDHSDPTLTNCTFTGNSAQEGGGMHTYDFSSPILNSCSFSGNSAHYGGGIYSELSMEALTNCTFSGNSAEYDGGGMYGYYGKPTLTNCTFSGNSAGGDGGGMMNMEQGSPTLASCTFTGNSANGDGGGMMNIERGSPTLTSCTFTGNSSGGRGGGICNDWYGSPTRTDCTLSGNSAKWRGGGMYSHHYGSPTLNDCTFSGNSAYYGGGMSNDDSSPTLSNCTFAGNSAQQGGGMHSYHYSSPNLYSCSFRGNSAKWSGGGMYNFGRSSPTLTGCTFSGNSAGAYGGGINCSGISSPMLTNCTLAQNLARYGNSLACYSFMDKNPSNVELINCILWGGGDEIWNNDGSTIDISYSNIQGGQTDIFDPCEAVVWRAGNIDTDPCFAQLGYWNVNDTPDDVNDDVWVDGDYHLQSVAGRWAPDSESWIMDDVNSPCIDAGDPNTCIGFEANPNGNVVNMGAYGGTAEASLSPSGIGCISADHPHYGEWVQIGAPACWCHGRQCHGDTDCKSQGKQQYWVSTTDLDVLIAAWNKPFSEIDGQTFNGVPLICADFDHLFQGKKKYRVSVNDLDILIANWNEAEKPDPNCP
ncbi:MAG: hypothetical protein PVJ86_09245 [Phycisphaerales bacterium]